MSLNYILRRRRLGNTSCREIAAKSQTGITVIRNDGHLPNTDGYVFRWGCTSEIPGNPKVINKTTAIHAVNDKAGFRRVLQNANPDFVPKTWFSYPHFFAAGSPYPVVVRRRTHAQGRYFHVCNNQQELKAACDRYGPDQYYISKLINKVAEYRVCVAFGRVAWVAKKTPGNLNQVAWNVAQGGAFHNVNWNDWPLKAVKMSVEVFKLSGLDFAGVDIMEDAQGKCYVLEVNSAMSLTSPYRQECIAKVFDYVVQNGRNHIGTISSLGDWKKFIHPSLHSGALMP